MLSSVALRPAHPAARVPRKPDARRATPAFAVTREVQRTRRRRPGVGVARASLQEQDEDERGPTSYQAAQVCSCGWLRPLPTRASPVKLSSVQVELPPQPAYQLAVGLAAAGAIENAYLTVNKLAGIKPALCAAGEITPRLASSCRVLHLRPSSPLLACPYLDSKQCVHLHPSAISR